MSTDTNTTIVMDPTTEDSRWVNGTDPPIADCAPYKCDMFIKGVSTNTCIPPETFPLIAIISFVLNIILIILAGYLWKRTRKSASYHGGGTGQQKYEQKILLNELGLAVNHRNREGDTEPDHELGVRLINQAPSIEKKLPLMPPQCSPTLEKEQSLTATNKSGHTSTPAPKEHIGKRKSKPARRKVTDSNGNKQLDVTTAPKEQLISSEVTADVDKEVFTSDRPNENDTEVRIEHDYQKVSDPTYQNLTEEEDPYYTEISCGKSARRRGPPSKKVKDKIQPDSPTPDTECDYLTPVNRVQPACAEEEYEEPPTLMSNNLLPLPSTPK